MAIGERTMTNKEMRRLRRILDLSQRDVAMRAQLSPSIVCLVEQGNTEHIRPQKRQLIIDVLHAELAKQLQSGELQFIPSPEVA
jgi:transcriptional regulator with XRE-family HTH domain